MAYLAPLHRASMNDWTKRLTDAQIDDYVELFDLLAVYQDDQDWVTPGSVAKA
jgi:hypothetical protein